MIKESVPVDYADLLHFAEPQSPGFSIILQRDGVTLASKAVEGYPIHMTKGYMEMPCTPLQFMLCLSPDVRGAWDELFIEGTTLQTKCGPRGTADHRYMAFRSPSPLLSPRDFEVFTSELTAANGTALVRTVSVPAAQQRVGASQSYVRGEVTLAGFVAVPKGVKGCRVTYVALVDPKGWVPPVLLNMLQSRQLESMIKLRNYAAKHFHAKL